MFSGRPFIRSLVLLLAISATLLVSTVAASPAHFHKDNYGGSCDICAIAHLPVVQPAVTAHVFLPAMSKLGVTVQVAARPSDPFVQLKSTRGPPQLLAVFA